MIASRVHPARAVRTLAFAAACLLLPLLAGCNGGSLTPSTDDPDAEDSVAIDSVSPSGGPFIGGTAVVLRGSRFTTGSANEVLFGGVPATDVVVVSSSKIRCVTPAGTPGARVDVVVNNARGQGTLTGGFGYAEPAPILSDLNGDGLADLVVAAAGDSTAGAGAGAVFVYFGREQTFQLDGLDAGQADVKLLGQKPGDAFGSSLACGDIDGDGIDDLVVGAARADILGTLDAGAAYVFRAPLGESAVVPAQAAWVKFSGVVGGADDQFGALVEVGDVTGDARADILVSAPGHDGPLGLDLGCASLFRGGPTLSDRSADAADLVLEGLSQGDILGQSIGCGDLDGDDIADLVITAPSYDVQMEILQHDAGRVWIVRGGSQVTQASLPSATIVLDGETQGDLFGTTITIADVDGDGQADLIVGAPGNDAGAVDSGSVYVFRGGPSFSSSNASAAPIRITGLPTLRGVGRSLRAGDVDGDSIADLVIGAPYSNLLSNYDGVVAVFRGGPDLASGAFSAASAQLRGDGAQLDRFGEAISALDLNGDGFADLAIASAHHAGVGRVYAWLGGVGAISGIETGPAADVQIDGTQQAANFGAVLAPGQ